MADISAKDVAALRKITGAGMMDCKKALDENDGDIDAREDWLREKGIAGAAKRAGREADQGAVDVRVTGNVARPRRAELRDGLRGQGRRLQGCARRHRRARRGAGDRRTSRTSRSTAKPSTISSKGFPARLGEKIQLGRIVRFETTDGLLDGYKHVQNERGTIGVIVEFGGVDRNSPPAREVAHDIALHIANKSTAPRYVSRDEFPADDVEAERAFHEKQTARGGQA